MYSLTKAAAMEISEKNKFQLKGRYKSEAGDGIPIGAFNVPRGSVTKMSLSFPHFSPTKTAKLKYM